MGGLDIRAHESEFRSPVTSVSKRTSSGDTDQLDRAGQTILQLLNKAVGVAEGKQQTRNRHGAEAFALASHRRGLDRGANLEAEVASHQEQAERAEQWVHKVYSEIEDRFLRQDETRRGVPQRR